MQTSPHLCLRHTLAAHAEADACPRAARCASLDVIFHHIAIAGDRVAGSAVWVAVLVEAELQQGVGQGGIVDLLALREAAGLRLLSTGRPPAPLRRQAEAATHQCTGSQEVALPCTTLAARSGRNGVAEAPSAGLALWVARCSALLLHHSKPLQLSTLAAWTPVHAIRRLHRAH